MCVATSYEYTHDVGTTDVVGTLSTSIHGVHGRRPRCHGVSPSLSLSLSSFSLLSHLSSLSSLFSLISHLSSLSVITLFSHLSLILLSLLSSVICHALISLLSLFMEWKPSTAHRSTVVSSIAWMECTMHVSVSSSVYLISSAKVVSRPV